MGYLLKVFYDFINLTQVHNLTVNAKAIFTFDRLPFYRKFYMNLARINADNETFCS